jgi:hypothetical protein
MRQRFANTNGITVNAVAGTYVILLGMKDNDSYYIQAARYNDLNKFRHLKGGEKLVFPPLLQSAS